MSNPVEFIQNNKEDFNDVKELDYPLFEGLFD